MRCTDVKGYLRRSKYFTIIIIMRERSVRKMIMQLLEELRSVGGEE